MIDGKILKFPHCATVAILKLQISFLPAQVCTLTLSFVTIFPESNPSGAHRKDHEFIPTRMKTIAASKPASDPKQFTRIPSNPLLISATKQMMQVKMT